MNPVMALGVKQDAVLCAGRTTRRASDAVVQAPTRSSGDLDITNRAETALFIPEKAKDTGTPKRFSHVSFFAFFEVGLIGGVVGIRVSLYFGMTLDECAAGAQQPDLSWLSIVIQHFAEERPIQSVVLSEVFLFTPAGGLPLVPSSCPSP